MSTYVNIYYNKNVYNSFYIFDKLYISFDIYNSLSDVCSVLIIDVKCSFISIGICSNSFINNSKGSVIIEAL